MPSSSKRRGKSRKTSPSKMKSVESVFLPVEAIVKPEQKEFTGLQNRDLSLEEKLRTEAGIFLDPVVDLQRISSNGGIKRFSLISATRYGNEGLTRANSHTCFICQKVTSNRRNLRSHMDNLHFKTKKLFCDLCPKIYFSKVSIRHHMNVHATAYMECPICQYKTVVKQLFDAHKFLHLKLSGKKAAPPKNVPKKSCPICLKIVTRDHLKDHMLIHKIRKRCKSCGATFESSEDLRRHILRTHYEGKLFDCHCGSVYKRIDALVRHKKTHEGKLSCDVCRKEYSCISHLSRHRKVKKHGKPEVKVVKPPAVKGPVTCDQCGVKLSCRRALRTHNAIFHQEANVFCDMCPQHFTNQKFLEFHIKRIHVKTRRFKCKYCDYKSITKWHLKRHMRIHGPGSESDLEPESPKKSERLKDKEVEKVIEVPNTSGEPQEVEDNRKEDENLESEPEETGDIMTAENNSESELEDTEDNNFETDLEESADDIATAEAVPPAKKAEAVNLEIPSLAEALKCIESVSAYCAVKLPEELNNLSLLKAKLEKLEFERGDPLLIKH